MNSHSCLPVSIGPEILIAITNALKYLKPYLYVKWALNEFGRNFTWHKFQKALGSLFLSVFDMT